MRFPKFLSLGRNEKSVPDHSMTPYAKASRLVVELNDYLDPGLAQLAFDTLVNTYELRPESDLYKQCRLKSMWMVRVIRETTTEFGRLNHANTNHSADGYREVARQLDICQQTLADIKLAAGGGYTDVFKFSHPTNGNDEILSLTFQVTGQHGTLARIWNAQMPSTAKEVLLWIRCKQTEAPFRDLRKIAHSCDPQNLLKRMTVISSELTDIENCRRKLPQ